jgi:hypothetical protein
VAWTVPPDPDVWPPEDSAVDPPVLADLPPLLGLPPAPASEEVFAPQAAAKPMAPRARESEVCLVISSLQTSPSGTSVQQSSGHRAILDKRDGSHQIGAVPVDL